MEKLISQPKMFLVACAIAYLGGVVIPSSSLSQATDARIIRIEPAASAPIAAGAGGIRGAIRLTTTRGNQLEITAFANETEGRFDTIYQCPELIVRYAAALGFSERKLGNGLAAAEAFAAISGKQFSFEQNGKSTEPPVEGAVISIAGVDTKGGSFPPPEGRYGHVGIVQKAIFAGDRGTITLFDQNWPGKAWKTISFQRRAGVWSGTMTNNPAGGQSQIINVAGWANPVRLLVQRPNVANVTNIRQPYTPAANAITTPDGFVRDVIPGFTARNWYDGGPGCVSIRRQPNQRIIILRAWYCEATETTATPLTLEWDSTVGAFVHELSGLQVNIVNSTRIRITSSTKIQKVLGENFWLAENTRDFTPM